MNDDAMVLDRVCRWTWALLDEQIAPEEFAALKQLLMQDETARREYLDCVQLHAELRSHFATDALQGTTERPALPILGYLSTDDLPLRLQSPPAHDSNS